MKKKKQKRKYKSRYKKYVAGGMYADNTVAAAGQGMPGTTANIVFDQNNPGLLRKNLSFLEDTKAKIQAENEDAVSSIKETDEQGKIDIERAAAEQGAKVDMAGTVIGTGLQAGKQTGLISKDAGSLGFKDAVKAYKAQKAINLTAQSQDVVTGAKTASDVGTTTGTGVQAAGVGADIAKSGVVSGTAGGVTSGGFGAVTSGAQTAQTAGTAGATASTAGQTGSAVAAGLGTVAKNPNVYALAAQYGGKAIRKGADDDDATTWTTGEATGDILEHAGKYAGYGATIGAFGGPLAPITSTGGAIIGGIIGAGVGTYKGLSSRNKARKAKTAYEIKRGKQVRAYNSEVRSNLLMANAQVKGGEMEQKTYSGYDLGRNVVAKMGGMRMGMPRYGYTS